MPLSYSGLLSEVQGASTFVPTDVITAIAATTIRPAIRAYSNTSPPCSSDTNLLRSVFMTMAPYEDIQNIRAGDMPFGRPRGLDLHATGAPLWRPAHSVSE